jgi:ABC-type multidrug transport system fused ATPase/permease subunit
VAQVTKGFAAFVVAVMLDWRLSVVGVVVAPLLYTVIRKLGKRIRRASRRALESQAGLYERAGEVLGGLRVVKVHTTERAEAGRFHKVNKQVVRQELRVRTARALSSPLVETLAIFVLGALSVVAARQIIERDLDPARFVLVLMALAAAGASLRPLTGIINDIQQASAAAGRIDEILRLPAEPGHGHRLAKLPRHAQTIVFENVTFTYPEAREPALREINLTVRHGETVAFVGPNGSGKTTQLSLIPRLFDPESGRILIDGNDPREFAVRSLRRQIGVVTQEVVLFRGTIESNVAYGAEGVTEAKVREACRRARAEGFILGKPGGYAAEIGDDGAGLSGGQRQRLSIARAILRDPAILILDEATSMIDADSEAHIAEAISEFSAGRTCLIVAHRLSTVLGADRIVVLDEGRVVDEGGHEELLARCPTYQMIARNQLLGGTGNGRTGVERPEGRFAEPSASGTSTR